MQNGELQAVVFLAFFSWQSKLLQHLAQGYPGVLYRFFPQIISSVLFLITPTNSLLFSGDRKGRPAKRILHSAERTTPSVSFADSSLWECSLEHIAFFNRYQNDFSKKSCRPKIGLISKTDTTKMLFFENRLPRVPKNAIAKPFTAIF